MKIIRTTPNSHTPHKVKHSREGKGSTKQLEHHNIRNGNDER